MLSRVADSLYWMSRYLERAENTVRQLDVTMGLMLDTGGASEKERWQRLVASLGKPAGLDWNGNLEAMAHKLVFDNLNHAAVTFCVNGARENARQVREEISSEQWQRLNRLYHQIHAPLAEAQWPRLSIYSPGLPPGAGLCNSHAAGGLSARSVSSNGARA